MSNDKKCTYILNLYGAPDCGLCETANDILHEVVKASHQTLSVQHINIRTDKGLMLRYATKIPVLELVSIASGLTLSEDKKNDILYWPFDAESVLQCLPLV